MERIATAEDLATEIQGLLTYVANQGAPSRAVVAARLRELADRVAASTTKEEWEKALKADEANLAKMEKAVKLLEEGKPVSGEPHLKLDGAKGAVEGLKAVIHNKKQLISKL